MDVLHGTGLRNQLGWKTGYLGVGTGEEKGKENGKERERGGAKIYKGYFPPPFSDFSFHHNIQLNKNIFRLQPNHTIPNNNQLPKLHTKQPSSCLESSTKSRLPSQVTTLPPLLTPPRRVTPQLEHTLQELLRVSMVLTLRELPTLRIQ